ncbi:carbohydrate kinase family protein [Skermanella sp. TT6]|uniref:Carbohydrate kinase family protein n=1 Tax=Skermanella cutis TaxID=2775420 RepID=A0ABX7B9P5_9PROT|nr:carbohydrate kinase family protein [Skermanella sp. TT6]QQP91091.1 carbohydrate kinase family protein [Skermanella sp. TT6]
MEPTVACIGAAHIDRKAIAAGPVVPGSSNPVSMRLGMGGVARNVAENLARLGLPVTMVSRVGADREGDAVLQGLADAGIGVDACTRSATSPTASYTALIDRGGELVVGLADMGIYDELTAELIEPLLPRLERIPVWFIDCNLPAESLRLLLRRKPEGCTVYVDCVSVAKAARLQGILRGIDTLFANGDEAAYLSHVPIRAPLDVCEAGYRLMCNGVGSVVITRGQEGAFVASPFDYDFFLPPPVDVHEVTGAGDALVAGVIFGRIGGHSMEDAMRIGLACAAWAVETAETVNPSLNADLAIERAGLLRKSA